MARRPPTLDISEPGPRAPRWRARIVAFAARVLAALAFAAFALVTIGVVADLWRIVPVRSGSMEPTIPTESAVVARPVDADDLAVGDVVLFNSPRAEHRLLVHRIVEIGEIDGRRVYRTKGDANNAPDSWTLRFEEDQVWRVSRTIPALGRVIDGFRSLPVRVVALVVGVGLAIVAGLQWIWRRPGDPGEPDDEGAEGSPDWDSTDDPVARDSGRPRVGVNARVAFWAGNLGLVALAVVALVGPGAFAAFNTNRAVSGTYSTGVLTAPSPLRCVWAPLFGTYPIVWQIWNVSGQDFAAGYHVLRSDTSGGPYSLRGTITPNTAWITAEDSTPHTTVRYYVVESFRGNWTSPYTNEVATNQCQNAINPFAGNGTAGFSGDAGAATSAQLNSPEDVAFDSSGNAYIADRLNNRIRKVTPAGTISTFAGGTDTASACSYSGNVSSLRLNGPWAVAVDSADNVYISDTGQNCIRKVTPAGNVSLLAGGGATTTCNSTGAATSVSLNLPIGLAVDASGAVYIADAGNHCVRKVSGGTYSHVAGGGATTTCNSTGAATAVSLNLPADVAVDSSGTVYIADRDNNCVRKVTAGNYSLYAFTGTVGSSGNNGPAVEALASVPVGLAQDPSGHTYIVERGNNVVRKVMG